MKALLVVLLVLIAGTWGWAVFWPRDAVPLAEEFRGAFRIFHYEPPEGVNLANPFPQGQVHAYTFREDGTYLYQVFVSGDFEMRRNEGYVRVEDGLLVMEQVSDNRVEESDESSRWEPSWGQDDKGEFLDLKAMPDGYHILLRPVEEARPPPLELTRSPDSRGR